MDDDLRALEREANEPSATPETIRRFRQALLRAGRGEEAGFAPGDRVEWFKRRFGSSELEPPPWESRARSWGWYYVWRIELGETKDYALHPPPEGARREEWDALVVGERHPSAPLVPFPFFWYWYLARADESVLVEVGPCAWSGFDIACLVDEPESERAPGLRGISPEPC